MIIELVDKLIDRCIQLVQSDKQRHLDLFQYFVEPVFSQFEIVHNEYLASFKRYRDVLLSQNSDLRDVYHMILKDNLFTENQREKLRVLVRMSKEPEVNKFVYYIHQYLTSKDFKMSGRLPYDQRWELALYLQGKFFELVEHKRNIIENENPLQDLRQELKKEYAAAVLDHLVVEMQEGYKKVVEQYARLRELLIQ
jgi:hypothetical protein